MHMTKRIACALVILICSSFLNSAAYAQGFKPSPEQQQIQKSLAQKMPNLNITWDSRLRSPSYLSGISSEPLKPEPDALRRYFIDNFKTLYQIKAPDKEIQTGRTKTDKLGLISLQLYQKYENIPVYGISLILQLDKERRLQSIHGKWITGIDLDITPKVDKDKAVERILNFLQSKYTGKSPLPQDIQLKPDKIGLFIFNPAIYGSAPSKNHLAYHVVVKTQVFFVDAHTGEIVYSYSNIQDARNRRTHMSNSCSSLPGTLVLNESGPVGGATPDVETQNAHIFAGTVYDYYSNTHGRDSYDGNGSAIVSTVHSGVPLDILSLLICCLLNLNCCGCLEANAAWIPSLNQMVYGDGGTLADGRSFNPFTNALDVVAHEITHGVTAYSIRDINGDPVGLDYTGESGALNESFSDVFGAMVDRVDWLMGEDLVISGYAAGAMRNLADPTNGGSYNPADPSGSVDAGHQPDHKDNYVASGDVHINSGIPNKVAYLVSEGGTHPHSNISVRGIGRSATEKIWYDILTNRLQQTSTFLEARQAAENSVRALYPGDNFKYITVWNAFVACGICSNAIDGHCDPKTYPPSSWKTIYRGLFASNADVEIFRKYRDKTVAGSEKGKLYTTLLYKSSDEALDVLERNPKLVQKLKALIDKNKEAFVMAEKGGEGVISNTDEVISFLDSFAKESPLALRVLANLVKADIISKRKEGQPFMGLRLE